MRAWSRVMLVAALTLALAPAPDVVLQAQAPAVEAPVNSKTWIGRYQEYEEFLKTAEIERIEDVGMGVTKPRRAYLKAGGLFESMAWKPLKPGMQRGFWESYKAEIAAYEIDKLLKLDMVPPAVERRIEGELGVAVMWVSPTRMWKVGEAETPTGLPWVREIVRMKMLDNLIGNIDRNAGNLLVDPSWNLILIDHSRALTTKKDLPAKMNRIDRDLWQKMNELTEESMTAALGEWLSKSEIKAIFDRRTAMDKEIKQLIAKTSEPAVYLPVPPPTN